MARAPSEVYGDITRLPGSEMLCYSYLYVALDISSRYGTSWPVAERATAEHLITERAISAQIAHSLDLPYSFMHHRNTANFSLGRQWRGRTC